jgi:hypothetical protein
MASAETPKSAKNSVMSAVWINTPIDPVTELWRAMMWSASKGDQIIRRCPHIADDRHNRLGFGDVADSQIELFAGDNGATGAVDMDNERPNGGVLGDLRQVCQALGITNHDASNIDLGHIGPGGQGTGP